jgi:hypothetical protein
VVDFHCAWDIAKPVELPEVVPTETYLYYCGACNNISLSYCPPDLPKPSILEHMRKHLQHMKICMMKDAITGSKLRDILLTKSSVVKMALIATKFEKLTSEHLTGAKQCSTATTV